MVKKIGITLSRFSLIERLKFSTILLNCYKPVLSHVIS